MNTDQNAAKPKLSRSEQARINGSKSKGPKTLAGKARCSVNAVKIATHADVNMNWLPIENGVLSGESRELAFGLFEAALAQFQPQSALEIFTIKKLVFHQCALDRLDRAESAMLQTHWNEVTPTLEEHFKTIHNQEPSRAVHTAQALTSLALQEEKVLRVLSRLRRDHERSVASYIRRLKELRKNFPVTEAIDANPMALTEFYGLLPDDAPASTQQQSAQPQAPQQPAPQQPAPQSETTETKEPTEPTPADPENRPKPQPIKPSNNQQLNDPEPSNSTTDPEPNNPPIAA